MSVINILSPHVADLIAAGEVVERPASVVKELVENSFDAGATIVTVEIRNGGMSCIRVTDNGCGMSPEDAGVAFIRHATSKLNSEDGLGSIATMGFRGEALAAISSVSNMEIRSRERGSSEGVSVQLSASDLLDMVPCGCPEGTTVNVRNLFFNTPARLKFMKSDRAETSSCVSAALRCALGRPDVSVRLIRDGTEEFFSPGDGTAAACIYALLGREEASSMIPCCSSLGSLRMEGFISSPAEGRGNRAHQFFFVNGRSVRSQLLQSALEQAYRDTLLVGRYPSCVLYLTMPYNEVDVNVHPAKTEVRFVNEKAVFDFVYSACRMALSSENRLAPSGAAPAPSVSPEVSGNAAVSGKAPAADVPDNRPAAGTVSGEIPSPAPAPETAPGTTAVSVKPGDFHRPGPVFHASGPEPPVSFPGAGSARPDLFSCPDRSGEAKDVRQAPSSGEPCYKNVENSVRNVENPAVPPYRILGEAFRTYIIVELGGELLLIDKHAAHERLIFDRLCASIGPVRSQLLLSQVTLRLSGAEAEAIEQNGELLARLGFEIEPYGENTFIVRAIPATMGIAEVSSAIEEICDKLTSGKLVDPEEKRRELLHTVACKAAIKAGWDTQDPELKALVDAVVSGKIRYCPHGRPVSATVSRKDLDKLFKRIV